jgi:hypothetical protein
MRWLVAIGILAVLGCGRERRPPSPIRDVGPRDASNCDAGDCGASDASGCGSGACDASECGSAGDCGVSEADAGSDAGFDAGSDAGSDAGGGMDAATPDGGPGFRLCSQICAIPNDCVPANNALQDADNWLCTNNHCEYRGCLSTQECAAVFGASYVCVQHTGQTIAGCVESCLAPPDCEAASPIFGADNYACESNGCRWLGCNTDDECRTTFNDPTYVCEVQNGFRNCIRPCADVTDCATTSPAFDADNYACSNQRCTYLGCNDDNECAASFQIGSWECP